MKMKSLWTPVLLFTLFAAALLVALQPAIAAAWAPTAHDADKAPVAIAPSSYKGSLTVIVHEISPYNFDLLAVDVSTGRVRTDLEAVPLGREWISTLSEDGRWAAFAVKPSNAAAENEALILIDLADWSVTRIDYDFNYQAARLVLDPANRRLVLIEQLGAAVTYNTGYRYTTYDWEQQAVIATVEDAVGIFPSHVALLDDGQKLAVEGQTFSDVDAQHQRGFALIDVLTLEVEWADTLSGVRSGPEGLDGDNWAEAEYFQPGIAFDAAHSLLYVAHPDSDEVTIIDFAQRAVSTTRLQPKAADWLHALLLADAQRVQAKIGNGTTKQALVVNHGATLVISGQTTRVEEQADGSWLHESESHLLLVVDTASMAVLHRLQTPGDYIQPGTAPNEVLVNYIESEQPVVSVLDVNTGTWLATDVAGSAQRLPLVDGNVALVGYRYLPDGNPQASKGDQHALVIYGASYAERWTLTFPGYSNWLYP